MSLDVNASDKSASKFKSGPFFSKFGAFLPIFQSSHHALPKALQYFYVQYK